MKFVWPPILSALENRETQIADGLAAAEKGQETLVQAGQRHGEHIYRKPWPTRSRSVAESFLRNPRVAAPRNPGGSQRSDGASARESRAVRDDW